MKAFSTSGAGSRFGLVSEQQRKERESDVISSFILKNLSLTFIINTLKCCILFEK